MPNNRDDITLNVGMSVDDVVSTSEQLKSRIEKMFKGSGKLALTDGMKQSMVSAYDQATKLQEKLKGFSTGRELSQPYKELNKEIENTQFAYRTALELKEKMETSTKGAVNIEYYKAMEFKVGQLAQRMTELKDKRDALVNSGKAFAPLQPGLQRQFDATVAALNRTNNRMYALAHSANDANKKVDGLGKKLTKLGASKIASIMNKLKGAFRESAKSSNDFGDSLNRSLKTILKYVFGIRSIFLLIRRLRSTLKKGWGEMAQYSEPFNRSISEIVTSFAYLKRALATTFAPLVTVVSPILSAFMDQMVAVMNTIGQFFAMITGQNTFIRAKKVYVDYAKSLSGVSDSADDATKSTEKQTEALKEQKKTISGFDDVEILHEDKDDATNDLGNTLADAGAAAGPEFYETVSPYATKLTEKLKDIFEVFKKAWDQEGEKTVRAAKYALNQLKSLAVTVADTFYKVFTAGYGFDWLVSGLQLLQTMLYIVGDIARTFKSAWLMDNTGYNLIANIFVLFTNINNLLRDIGQSFRAAWNDGTGVSIINNILNIFSNIFEALGNITERIREAWNEDSLGVKIWNTILGIVDDLASTFNEMTESLVTWTETIDFSPLLTSIENVLQVFREIAGIAEEKLQWVWTNILLPLGEWTIQASVPAILNAIAGAFSLIASFASVVWSVLEPFVSNFLMPIASGIGAVAVTILNGVGQVFSKIANSSAAVGVLVGALAALAGIALHNQLPMILATIIAIIGKIVALAAAINPVTLAIVGLSAVIAICIVYWDEIWTFLKTIGNAIVSGVVAVVEKIKSALQAVINTVTGAIKAVYNGFIAFKNELLKAFASIGTWFKQKFAEVKDAILAGFTAIANWFKNIKTWIANNIVNPFLNGIKGLFGIVGATAREMQTVGSALIDGMVSGISGVWHTITDFFSTGVTEIFDFFTNTDWWSIGDNIIGGIADGIMSGWNWLTETISDVASSLFETATSVLGIHSPSRLFRDGVGKNITAGIALGVNADASTALSAVTALSNKIANVPFEIPDIAKGNVIPYAATITAQQNNQLEDMLSAMNNNDYLTREDLREVMTDVFRRFMQIDFYIGDEQVARHNQLGQAKLNKRMSMFTN